MLKCLAVVGELILTYIRSFPALFSSTAVRRTVYRRQLRRLSFTEVRKRGPPRTVFSTPGFNPVSIFTLRSLLVPCYDEHLEYSAGRYLISVQDCVVVVFFSPKSPQNDLDKTYCHRFSLSQMWSLIVT